VEIRSLGYRTDIMIRVLEGSHTEDRGDYLVVRTPANPSFWWGNFLLLSAAPSAGGLQGWLETFASEFPAALHVTLGIDVTDAAGVSEGEFVAAGFSTERTAIMTAAEIHEPPHPNPGAAYRPLAGDDDWRQSAELRAAVTSGGPGSDPEFLGARIAAERALTEAGHGCWFGAFIGDTLVAQLGLVTDGSGLARYQNVETLAAVRRQGLAGSLVWKAGLHFLRATGGARLVMAADPDDVAIRVYRSVGFAVTQTQIGFARQP
jgi:hypothetical protein